MGRTDDLLAELSQKREWLRVNATGTSGLVTVTRNRVRAIERELKSLDVDVDAALAGSVRSPWFVVVSILPGERLLSRSRHRDRHCQHIAHIDDVNIREATDAEIAKLPVCGTCG